jgi:hypothetical protein
MNMKDVNKILAKVHFKCIFFLNYAKKQYIFCGSMSPNEAVGSLPVFCKCGEPWSIEFCRRLVPFYIVIIGKYYGLFYVQWLEVRCGCSLT